MLVYSEKLKWELFLIYCLLLKNANGSLKMPFYIYCPYSYQSKHLPWIFKCSPQHCLVRTRGIYEDVLRVWNHCCLAFATLTKENNSMHTQSYILMHTSVALRLSLAIFVLKVIFNKQTIANNYLFAIGVQVFNKKLKTSY